MNADSDINWNEEVAGRLKTLRSERDWSLDQAAEATGVSKAMLGQVERLESSPTVNTIWKLANGFGVPFSAFFADGSASDPAEHGIYSDEGTMEVVPLFQASDDVPMEMFEIRMGPAFDKESAPHPAGSTEHIVVIFGQMKVFFDDKWHTLGTGDRVRFKADQPHQYKAITPLAVFHNVIFYK